MKNTLTCPKCGGRKLFHVPEVGKHYYNERDVETAARSEVTAVELETGEKGFFGDKTEVLVAGPYESVICAGCGYAEWYATRHALAKLAEIAEKCDHVRVIDGGAARPFR